MKSERRHELQENELASRLETGIVSLKPYLGWIAGGVCAVVLAVVGIGAVNANAKSRSMKAWDDYLDVVLDPATLDAETLESVASANPQTGVVPFADIRAGDLYLGEGLEFSYSDRTLSHEQLRKAKEAYQRALDALSARDSLLRNRAQLGLGRACEALNQLDDAKNHYRVVAEDVQSPLSSFARSMLENVEQDSTGRFYDWFATTELADASTLGPGASGDFGDLPGFEGLPAEEGGGDDFSDLFESLQGAPAEEVTAEESGDEATPPVVDEAVEFDTPVESPAEEAAPDAAESDASEAIGDAAPEAPAPESPVDEAPTESGDGEETAPTPE